MLQTLQMHRALVCPNDGFEEQLQNYYTSGKAEKVRQKLPNVDVVAKFLAHFFTSMLTTAS